MKPGGPPPIRHGLVCAVVLGSVFVCAPWPSVQGVLHALLVLGLAPQAGNLLTASLWAGAAGWVVEGTLRTYPVLGGTAWADLTVVAAAFLLRRLWPAERLGVAWGQLAALTLLQGLAIHAAVRWAAGPHPWGGAWLWALAAVPLWGTLVHRFQTRPHRD